MNLSVAEEGKEYTVKRIETDDEDLNAFLFSLVCNTVVQIVQTFNWSFQEAEVASESILATIANPIAYLLVPIVGVALIIKATSSFKCFPNMCKSGSPSGEPLWFLSICSHQ